MFISSLIIVSTIAVVMALVLPDTFDSSSNDVPQYPGHDIPDDVPLLRVDSPDTGLERPSVSAQYLSGPAPIIDGVLAPGEWPEPGFNKPFDYSWNGTERTGNMVGYFANDDDSLFAAITVSADDFRESVFDEMRVGFYLHLRFDGDNDGIIVPGEDIRQISEQMWDSSPHISSYSDLHVGGEGWHEWDEDSSGEGAMTFSDQAHTFTFEFEMPLDCGDPEDLAVGAGDTIGVKVILNEWVRGESGEVWSPPEAAAGWPTGRGKIDANTYGKLVLASGPSTVLTPTPTHSPIPMPSMVSNGSWDMNAVGNSKYDWMINALAIGDGRNDEETRIYATGEGGQVKYIFEFTYSAGVWSKEILPETVYGWNHAFCVITGQGRYDKVERVYTAVDAWNFPTVHEYTYSGDSWSLAKWRLSRDYEIFGQTIAPAVVYAMSIGDVRNDGVPRLYLSVGHSEWPGGIVELSYASGTWSEIEEVGHGNDRMYDIAIGEGRHDGTPRVYGANADGHIYEFTPLSSNWQAGDIGSVPSPMNSVAIGDGRNDGILRVYGANSDGHVYEFSYSASDSKWIMTDIGYGGDEMHAVAVGGGRSDNVNRVYAANADGYIYEFSYSDGKWTKKAVGNGSSGMRDVAIGDGRNDGAMRTYAANEDGWVYEFSYNDAPATMALSPFVDLTIEDVAWTSRPSGPQNLVNFNVKIKKLGNVASGGFTVKSYRDDVQWNHQSFSRMPAGGIVFVHDFSDILEDGTYTFKFIIDADDEIAESNETNNEKEITLRIP